MGELAVILFWPALAGYAEAALAYLGDGLRPGRLSRFAIWGVRVGWLAQTALLVVQTALSVLLLVGAGLFDFRDLVEVGAGLVRRGRTHHGVQLGEFAL